MKRRALIIYCDNTESGELPGPPHDNNNFRDFLLSHLGGDWAENEIRSLRSPSSIEVLRTIGGFLKDSDYTFIVFTGHGFINSDDNNKQYVELSDDSIPISFLRTNSKRQTLIVDACRGYYSPTRELLKAFSERRLLLTGDISFTREIFERAVLVAEEGWTILYAANVNQTALDTNKGAAYLLSLLQIAELWQENDNRNTVLNLKTTHEFAKVYLSEHFETIQNPIMNNEKRIKYFPFAVKAVSLHG